MRVFMLGWEFPPFISGGLGTACHGLTLALSRQNTKITFVLPKVIDTQNTSHVRLLTPQSPLAESETPASGISPATISHDDSDTQLDPNIKFQAIPARMYSPYQSAGGVLRQPPPAASRQCMQSNQSAPATASLVSGLGPGTGPLDYSGDLLDECQRFSDLCLNLARGEDFDVIHAHDWLTFPAGLAVARLSGRPLITHVHSTEFDRSGENINQPVYDIERRGMHGAMRVIAVSYLTKSIIQHRFGVDPDKIEVVYNGIENINPLPGLHGEPAIRRSDKIVLFLGRITMQKGPEYFVRAAKKVLEKEQEVKFVMAGSGDKITDVIDLAVREGIGHQVLFTGFLRGKDVERVFRIANVYVMPSVSEPFGIAPLEAIRHDVPVIISKTSGVAEVLTHALKVDFWDTDEIANKIIAVLRHPPLSSTLREQADLEVRQLTWDGAAKKCLQVYDQATQLVSA